MPRKGMKKIQRVGDAAVAAFRSRPVPKKARAKKAAGASRTFRRQTTVFGNMRQPVSGIVNAPLSTGARLGAVSMRMSDEAAQGTDQGSCSSVRICGTDISKVTLTQKIASPNSVSFDAAASVLAVKFGPGAVSDRLANFAGYYSYYAFRDLTLTFIPLVGPASVASTTVIGAPGIVAVALMSDVQADVNADGPNTVQHMMEVDPSVAFPAWEGGVLRYRFDGKKLWATSTNSQGTLDLNDKWQLGFSALWAGDGTTTLQTTSHLIYVQYVIDLYRPQEPTAYPTVGVPRAPSVRELRIELDRLALRLAASEREDTDEKESDRDGRVLVSPVESQVAKRLSSRTR